jgi:hypothetical protein
MNEDSKQLLLQLKRLCRFANDVIAGDKSTFHFCCEVEKAKELI